MNNNHFKKWFEEADMPTQTPSGWVDLETGIAYDSNARKQTSEYRAEKVAKMTAKHSAAIEAAQAATKAAGWSALTGTAPQKLWATQLRAALIPQLPVALQDVAGRITQSKFWIENREKDMRALSALVESMRAELEEKAAARKAAAVKAKATAAANKSAAAKEAAYFEVIFELLADAESLSETPKDLGIKIFDGERSNSSFRVFMCDTTIVFLVKHTDSKEILRAVLDDERIARIKAIYS